MPSFDYVLFMGRPFTAGVEAATLAMLGSIGHLSWHSYMAEMPFAAWRCTYSAAPAVIVAYFPLILIFEISAMLFGGYWPLPAFIERRCLPAAMSR